MRWCARCRRRLYDESAAYCPFDGTRLEIPEDPAGASDPHLGAVLQNQFQLIEAIGSGAMGTVYRAWQRGMEREVAVKVLRADHTADADLRRRFLREGRTSARLDHPNIVSVFMVGETDAGAPYLVMEHLGGETLEQVLEREGRFSPARAADVARQIAAGLAQAHAAGVVHRDLKPGNVVLLDRRGTGELVKIFDFGIAKLADRALAADGGSRLTRDGAIFGTPDYIAPEQAQGAAVDGRADLYSLGVLLYRMLAGRLPFDGNAVAVILAHIGRPPPELTAVAPDVPAELAAVVMRCLAKDPAHRHATAEHFLDDLAAAMRAPAHPRPSSSHSPRTEALARASSPDPIWASRAAADQPMAASSERQQPVREPSNPRPPPPPLSEAPHPQRSSSDARHPGRASSESLHPARAPSESLHPGRAPPRRAPGMSPPPARVRVVEAIGLVADPGLAAARAAGPPSASRTWLRAEAGGARWRGGRRAVRGMVASVGIAVVCAGAGTGAASLVGRAGLGSPARAAETVSVAPVAGADAMSTAPTVTSALEAVVLGERGYTVRALVPRSPVAGRPFELVFELWDRAGEPLEVPAVPVTLSSLTSPRSSGEADGAEPALAARPSPGAPGRYRVAVRFATAGPAAALLELPDESSLHLHFDVAPAPR